MVIRKLVVGLAGMTAAAALVMFAFGSGLGTARAQQPPATPTPANTSHGISNLSCSFSPSPPQLNTAESVTCSFDYFGTAHTFVANFEISTTSGFQVTGCTLDSNPFSGGPCP